MDVTPWIPIYKGVDRAVGTNFGSTTVTNNGVVFTDSTLTAGGSVVAAAHVLDLRSAIDALRTQYRLASYAWSNALAGGSTLVRAIDLAEVRAALEATYVAAGVAPPTYTDPTIAAGETVIKASHVTEARNAVRAIE